MDGTNLQRTINVDWRVWEKKVWELWEFWIGSFYLNEPRQILRGSVLRVLCCPDNTYYYCYTVDDEINCWKKQPAQFFVFLVNAGNGFFEMTIDCVSLKWNVCHGRAQMRVMPQYLPALQLTQPIDRLRPGKDDNFIDIVQNNSSLCMLSWGCACPLQLLKYPLQISPCMRPPFVRLLEVQL